MNRYIIVGQQTERQFSWGTMNKIILTFLAVLITVSSASLASAQDLVITEGTKVQAAVSPEKAALIKELFEATGGRETFNDMISNIMSAEREQSKHMMDKIVGDLSTSTPAEKAEMAKIANESVDRINARTEEFFKKQFGFERVVALVTPLYDKHFTADELRDVIAFYRTPTGQKTMKEMPQMMGEIIGAISKEFMPGLMDFVKQTTDEETAALKKKLPMKRPVRKTSS